VTSANRRRHTEEDEEESALLDEFLADAQTCLVLTFLLGITWSIGYLIRGEMARYAAFVFVLANGCVGIFTFLHTIVLNESMLGELMVRLGLRKGQYVFTPGVSSRRVRKFNREKSTFKEEKTKKKATKKQEYKETLRSTSLTGSDSTSVDTSSTPAEDSMTLQSSVTASHTTVSTAAISSVTAASVTAPHVAAVVAAAATIPKLKETTSTTKTQLRQAETSAPLPATTASFRGPIRRFVSEPVADRRHSYM